MLATSKSQASRLSPHLVPFPPALQLCDKLSLQRPPAAASANGARGGGGDPAAASSSPRPLLQSDAPGECWLPEQPAIPLPRRTDVAVRVPSPATAPAATAASATGLSGITAVNTSRPAGGDGSAAKRRRKHADAAPAAGAPSRCDGASDDGDSDAIPAFVTKELLTPLLDRMSPYLWLAATQSSAHVSPLHEQLVRGRSVVASENPELHLVWVEDRVFVKPMPPWLMSWAFWKAYLTLPEEGRRGAGSDEDGGRGKSKGKAWIPQPAALTGVVSTGEKSEGVDDQTGDADARDDEHATSALLARRAAALGFMRTYFYLVRHEGDFRLAQELHLLPTQAALSAAASPHNPLTWPSFVAFISAFSPAGVPPHLRPPGGPLDAQTQQPQPQPASTTVPDPSPTPPSSWSCDGVSDDVVSPRYRFGQLRLTRLNLWAKAALGRWKFYKVSWQYADQFARLYAPLLFVFAIVSIALSAFQVGAQAAPQWDAFAAAASWFSVASLAGIGAVGVGLAALLAFMLLRELAYAMGWTR